MWTAWAARTRTIGDPDLRLKLLVGSEATHYTNVPCVAEVSGDYFPLYMNRKNSKERGRMPGASLRMRNADSFLRRFWLNYSAL